MDNISEKYILIDVFHGDFEHEIATPMIFDTIENARAAMRKSLICGAMGEFEDDDSVFRDYIRYEDYDWEPDANDAWFKNCNGRSDWVIYSIAELVKHTEKIRKSEAS